MKTILKLFLAVVLPALASGFVVAPKTPSSQKSTTSTFLWGGRVTPAPFSANLRTVMYAAGDKEGSNPIRIIIAGAPASGKGTQCEIIKEKFGVVHLSTGDMLRAAVAAQTEVGKKAKDFMDNGMLVPDEVIIGVVRCFSFSFLLVFAPIRHVCRS